MKAKYYILDENKNVVLCNDLLTWARIFKSSDRIVKQSRLGKITVSTVFLGLDHSFSLSQDRDPVVFETMIFGGKHNDYQTRYSTWAEAEKGHEKACRLAFGIFRFLSK